MQSQNSEKDLVFQTSLGHTPRQSQAQVRSPHLLGRHTVLTLMLTKNWWEGKTTDRLSGSGLGTLLLE